MIKNLILGIAFATIFAMKLKAQESSNTESVFRLNFLTASAEVELPTGNNSTFSTALGLDFSFFLGADHKFYYNFEKRKSEGKVTDNNSGNFIALRGIARGDGFFGGGGDINDKSKVVEWLGLGATWGLQRKFDGNFHLLFDIGPAMLYSTRDKDFRFYPMLKFNLGFDLKTKLMKLRIIILMLYVVLPYIVLAQTTSRPNVILIVADDLGYSDLGCYGGEIKTPSLDKLSNEGIRLSNMHNASMCVISRTSLLTGNWWTKAGSGIKNGPNLAQELKKVGYRTGIVGKWHLEDEPNNKGFDYFFGYLGGYASYFSGHKSYRLNKEEFTDYGKNYYSTDAFTDRAIDFVAPKQENGKEAPFFLYLSYQSPHNPLQAPKEDILKYRGKYLKGWESIRKARLKKQTELGILSPGIAIPSYPQNLPDWESLSDEQKDLEDLRMSVYAAMVERMDTGIGRLMKKLQETNQAENTLILFLSDNGTDSFSVMDDNMLKRGLLPGDPDSNYQLGTGWAYASVTPWRLYKISQHGGGVKTGAIAWWPKGIKKTGSVQSNALHVVDIMPTILETANYNNSKTADKFLKSLSGESFVSLLEGNNWERKSPMYFQFMDNRAIRTKEWSLLEVDGSGWELYDTKKDPLETNDLYATQKNIASQLSKDWMNWWLSYNKNYVPKSTKNSIHYSAQGDRGSGNQYKPSAMPSKLKNHIPVPLN